ncbi:protein of unknown function [Denitratisoma oestradiolicum]|uniref:Uncharacterized protein n=1 Tax=Denitratisoma oestradiolicum TaxID=311182 RepID=A0A6S6Y8K7_9PROT|nr:protein of unknown function [Denitratisoma oestradiolicum]
MFGSASLASFSAGGLLNAWGWQSVNLTVLPFLGAALIAAVGLGALRWRTRLTSSGNVSA